MAINIEDEKTTTKCYKNKNKLQQWTRDMWFCARGGEQIHTWQPM